MNDELPPGDAPRIYTTTDVLELARSAVEVSVAPFPSASTFVLVCGPGGDYRFAYSPQDRHRLVQLLFQTILEIERAKCEAALKEATSTLPS
jgi:hypothetical protein